MRPEEDDSDKCAYDAAAADDGDGGVLMLNVVAVFIQMMPLA